MSIGAVLLFTMAATLTTTASLLLLLVELLGLLTHLSGDGLDHFKDTRNHSLNVLQ